MTEEQQKRIDWGMVREWIGNNWFESDPNVSNAELDEMAIGIAGDIDDYIKANFRKLIQDIKSHAEKTVVSECVGEDPVGWIIMDKDILAIEDKWLG